MSTPAIRRCQVLTAGKAPTPQAATICDDLAGGRRPPMSYDDRAITMGLWQTAAPRHSSNSNPATRAADRAR